MAEKILATYTITMVSTKKGKTAIRWRNRGFDLLRLLGAIMEGARQTMVKIEAGEKK